MKSVLLILLFLISGCDQSELLTIRGNTMGTTYMVKVVDASEVEQELKTEIESELHRINLLMSTYTEESELSRLNIAETDTWFTLSSETLKVMTASLRFSQLSGGAFDMTVGPLVNLWGFGPMAGSDEIPSSDAVGRARAKVGYQWVEIDGNRLKKNRDVYIDLSAVAKGYGVDRLVELLENKGLKNYLVEIGGELRARGQNERQEFWVIAIESPEVAARSLFKALSIEDIAVATSGDYRNFFEIDGKRFSHTIDPLTGYPVEHSLASVSVLAETALLADGWATTLNVMGEEKGMALAEEQNLAALFIIRSEDGFKEAPSSAFKAYVSTNR